MRGISTLIVLYLFHLLHKRGTCQDLPLMIGDLVPEENERW